MASYASNSREIRTKLCHIVLFTQNKMEIEELVEFLSDFSIDV